MTTISWRMFAAVAALATALAGCGALGSFAPAGRPDAPATAPATLHAPEPTDDRARLDGIVAIVGATPLTWSDLEARAMRAVAAAVSAETSPARREEIRRRVLTEALEALILDELIEQEAARLAIAVSPAELDAAVAAMVAHFGGAEAHAERIEREGVSLAEYRELVRRHLIRARLLAREVGSRIHTGDDVLRMYYAEIVRGMPGDTVAPFEDVHDAVMARYLEEETERRARVYLAKLLAGAYVEIRASGLADPR